LIGNDGQEIQVSSTTDSAQAVALAANADEAEAEQAEERELQEQRTENGQAGERHRGRSAQKRIDGLTRQKNEEREGRLRAERELAELRERLNGNQPAQETTTKTADTPQTAAWIEALRSLPNATDVAYALSQNPEATVKLDSLGNEQAISEVRTLGQRLQEMRATEQFAAKISDEDKKEISAAFAEAGEERFKLPTSVVREIRNLENGVAVMKFLAHSPEECERLLGMNQATAAVELGRISARLEQKPALPVSNAPQPIRPLSGNGMRPPTDLDDPNISFRDFRAVRDKQEKAWRAGVRR
jgi:hypothetical protein